MLLLKNSVFISEICEMNTSCGESAEKFLATYLGGRYQESMTPEVAKRLGEIKVDVRKAF
jgi:hypothetical protein